MSKPLWVKVCGWAWLASVGLFIFGAFYYHAQGVDAGSVWWMLPTVPGMITLGPLWALGTLVHRSRVLRARIQAAVFSETIPRGPTEL